jgi:hypothetical protein
VTIETKAKSLGEEIQQFAADMRSDALGKVADADGWLRHDLYARLHDLGASVIELGADPALDIVFDGPPGPESGRFVEVETIEGRSVRVGEWIDRGNGLWALRITGSSIAAAIDRAALDGVDPALVAMDNAEEVEPQPDEIAAIEEARRLDDGSRATLDQVRAELGIGEDRR